MTLREVPRLHHIRKSRVIQRMVKV